MIEFQQYHGGCDMYHLNQFCNIISALRKQKGWTQAFLAEQLNISPQSISKWECGIGFPDVSLFPVLANLFSVPVGFLFGEDLDRQINDAHSSALCKSHLTFDKCKSIHVSLGNICRVEFINESIEGCRIEANGDSIFIRYFDVEYVDGKILVNIKNPCGSALHWESYDRKGYQGENRVKIFAKEPNILSLNYLDLHCCNQTNEDGNYEIICTQM